MCKERLHEIVKEEVNFAPENLSWRTTMKQGFARMDDEVQRWTSQSNDTTITCRCELQTPHCDAVGSTAVVAVVTPEKIIVSNCGDSRAVLCRKGVAIPLSDDHKVRFLFRFIFPRNKHQFSFLNSNRFSDRIRAA